MANNSIVFASYDYRRNKMSLYLESLECHCKVSGIGDSKKVDLIISSLGNDAYERLKISISPQKVADLSLD